MYDEGPGGDEETPYGEDASCSRLVYKFLFGNGEGEEDSVPLLCHCCSVCCGGSCLKFKASNG